LSLAVPNKSARAGAQDAWQRPAKRGCPWLIQIIEYKGDFVSAGGRGCAMLPRTTFLSMV
jgi:hypothetical protein